MLSLLPTISDKPPLWSSKDVTTWTIHISLFRALRRIPAAIAIARIFFSGVLTVFLELALEQATVNKNWYRRLARSFNSLFTKSPNLKLTMSRTVFDLSIEELFRRHNSEHWSLSSFKIFAMQDLLTASFPMTTLATSSSDPFASVKAILCRDAAISQFVSVNPVVYSVSTDKRFTTGWGRRFINWVGKGRRGGWKTR